MNRFDINVMRVTPELPEFETPTLMCQRFHVKEEDMLMALMAYGGRHPEPGVYTRLLRKGGFNDIVMSDTRAELWDHYEPLRRATGRVLLNGLGLGCVLKGILTKPDVEHVDVVEINTDLVVKMTELAPWCKDPRVTFHIADAHEMKWPVGTTWDYAWHDIWDHITVDNLPSYARLNRMYGGRVGHQGAWAHDLVKAQQRRDRDAWWNR